MHQGVHLWRGYGLVIKVIKVISIGEVGKVAGLVYSENQISSRQSTYYPPCKIWLRTLIIQILPEIYKT